MKDIKIITPRVPNFVNVVHAGQGNYMPLTAFTDEELEILAKEWRDDLFKNRDRQAKNNGSYATADGEKK